STVSVVSPSPGRRRATLGRATPARLALRATAAALACPGRRSAGGVGPLPSNARRRWPPEPTTIPFFVPSLRTAPRRLELPAMGVMRPSVTTWGRRGCLRRRSRRRRAARAPRRRPRNRGGRGHPAAAPVGRPPVWTVLWTPPRWLRRGPTGGRT